MGLDKRNRCYNCLCGMEEETFKSHGSKSYFRLKCPRCGMRSLSVKIRYKQVEHAREVVWESWNRHPKTYAFSWKCIKWALRDCRRSKLLAEDMGISLI